MTREMTDQEVTREVADIDDSSQWPNWPILPVKKYVGENGRHDMLAGIVTANNKTRIYMVNMWDLKADVSIGEQLEGLVTVNYESIEMMVRDGWMGD